jgi:histidinol-phosphate phosphatase family protein
MSTDRGYTFRLKSKGNIKMKNTQLKVDRSWTLFLDRDGVINKKLPGDYVKSISEFVFLPFVKEAIASLNQYFGRIIVITNQQGIGKGIMQTSDLEKIHDYMCTEISKSGAQIHQIYYCPDVAESAGLNRKPETGMALQAKKDFPEIDFSRTIMAGDSMTDMEFGKNLKLTTVYIHQERHTDLYNNPLIDYIFTSLKEFSEFIYESNKS